MLKLQYRNLVKFLKGFWFVDVLSNYDTSKKGRDHVRKSLEKEKWTVEIKGVKDEYFESLKKSNYFEAKKIFVLFQGLEIRLQTA